VIPGVRLVVLGKQGAGKGSVAAVVTMGWVRSVTVLRADIQESGRRPISASW